MATGIFFRNVRSRDQLELFLLAAASSVLLVRFYLHITGYPQIGSGGLHIAHMLWGGALMLIALVAALSFIGVRVQRFVAFVGGIGFGVFIDELGKFITRDNNYFYKPTIGLIYAIFIIMYLAFNFLSRKQTLTSREYQLNALSQLEEAIVRDMNPTEEKEVRDLISRADQNDPLTKKLWDFLHNVEIIPHHPPGWQARLVAWLDAQYETFRAKRSSNNFIRVFFVAEVLIVVGAVAWRSFANISSVFDLFNNSSSYSAELAVGQLIASLIAACFAIWGAIVLPRSHLKAYEQFRRATLVNIFLTQIFMFILTEFAALPGFFFNLGLLAVVTYAIRQEQRLAAMRS